MSRNLEFGVGEYYHIFSRGIDKRRIFLDEGDNKRFVKLLYSANSSRPVHLSNNKGLDLIDIPKGDNIVDVGAWCLMPNHFHILIKERSDGGISRYMQKLLTGYTMYFNKKCHRKGAFFESSFNAKHLDSDEYLKYLYAYIHLNPVSLVDSGWKNKNLKDRTAAKKFLASYKYSSFLDYKGLKRDEGVILEPKSFPEYFESFTEFGDMMDEWINFAAE